MRLPVPVKPLVDARLEVDVAHARGRANRLEHDLRDDAVALARLGELQARLRSALNASPQVREDVLIAADAIESFVDGVGRT